VAGQTLLALDATELDAQTREARARLEAAEASLARLRSVEAPIAASRLRDADLELEQAETDLGRYTRMLETGGVSEQRVDQVRRVAEVARARYEQARIEAESALTGAGLRAAEANVAVARAAVRAAASRQDLGRITSPAAGRVLLRSVEPGDAVQPGRTLMELALEGDVELVAFPEEEALGRLRHGQTAKVSADAFPSETFQATVARVGSVVDPQQGTVEIRLAVAEPPPYLLPDMTVSVNIETDRRRHALTLPREAITESSAGEAWVLVVRDGRAERAPVTLGGSDAAHVEIRDGVRPDEPVILRPGGKITPGTRVRAARRR
jgi:HlyD family secretion protein